MKLNKNMLLTTIFVVITLILFSVLIIWFMNKDIEDFKKSETRIIESAVNGGAREIGIYLKDLQRAVKLFSNQNKDLFNQLYLDFSDDELYKKLENEVKDFFPNYFAFTLTDENGISLLVNYDFYVGPQCRHDIDFFVKNKRNKKVFIHPKNRNMIPTYKEKEMIPFHFDIMTEWHGTNKREGVFFISFKLKEIMRMLEVMQPHNFHLIIVNQNNPKHIEVAAKNSIASFSNKPYLTEERFQSIITQKKIEGSNWLLVGLPHKELFSKYKQTTKTKFMIIEIIFFIIMLIMYKSLITSQKKQNLYFKSISETEKKYRNFVELAEDGIALIQKGHLIYTNPKLESLLEYSKSELKQITVEELFHLSSSEKPKLYYKSLEHNEVVPSFHDAILMNKFWQPVHVEINSTDILHEGVASQLLIIRDVSEKEKEKRIIKEQKEFLEIIINSLHYPFYVVNIDDYSIETANKAAYQLYEKRNQILTCYSITHGFDKPCQFHNLVCPIEEIKKTKKTVILEHVQYENDNPKFLELHAYPILNSAGEVTKVIEYIMDITDRKMRENELFMLNKAMEQSPALVLITDYKGLIQYVNPAFSECTGYSYNEAVGCNPSLIKSNVHDKNFYKELWKTILKGERWEGEIANRKKNGDLFWVKSLIAPVKDQNKKIMNFISLNIEITDQKRLEKLKENTERIVAHDLKNPLNAIFGYSQMLSDPDYEPFIQKAGQAIYKSAQQMYSMIEHSLDIFKMENGNYNLVKEPCNLIKLFQEIDNELENLIFAHEVKVKYFIDGKEINDDMEYMVPGEELHLKNLFSNLIKNAIEASPENGLITIFIDDSLSNHRIDIHNPGVIPEEIRECFFDPYITSGKKKGTGLGTYSAKIIAKAHGGDISFATSEEAGTHLIVLLPK